MRSLRSFAAKWIDAGGGVGAAAASPHVSSTFGKTLALWPVRNRIVTVSTHTRHESVTHVLFNEHPSDPSGEI